MHAFNTIKDLIAPQNDFYIFFVIIVKGILISKYFYAMHAYFNILNQIVHKTDASIYLWLIQTL